MKTSILSFRFRFKGWSSPRTDWLRLRA